MAQCTTPPRKRGEIEVSDLREWDLLNPVLERTEKPAKHTLLFPFIK